jgi:hypothetical protein
VDDEDCIRLQTKYGRLGVGIAVALRLHCKIAKSHEGFGNLVFSSCWLFQISPSPRGNNLVLPGV